MRLIVSISLALLSALPVSLFGQDTVSGLVLDSLTSEPLPFATVYVNGTSKGTVTDTDGRFELKDVSFPSTVVFSFVGYQPQAINLDRNPGKLTIRLVSNSQLPEIVVASKVERKDLNYFKKMFLGDDDWGRRATIKNEKVLMVDYSHQTSFYTREISKTRYATLYASNDIIERSEKILDTVKVETDVFSAWAYEPLIIDLPLLGYELYVDLVKFSVVKMGNISTCNILGYFYYKPYENLKKRRTERIEDNRRKAYYGSSQHFLRSFSENKLTENGFLLTMPGQVKKGRKEITVNLPVDPESYSSNIGDNLIQVHDLKDKRLRIRYYHGSYGTPVNFNKKYTGIRHYSESGLTFLQDTCTFLKDGIIIDNNIRFTGDISSRRIGSCLPDDYRPDDDESNSGETDSEDYSDELIRFAGNINQFNNMFPQEKVHLEFDNTAYFQGENIWFKAFVTHATTLESAPSGVLYVDFLAPTGKLIQQRKYKIEGGQADGVIPLIDVGSTHTRDKRGIMAFPSGFYEIRAYTQNMLNFSPDAIFSRVIPVYTQPKYVGEYNRSYVETSYNENPLIENLREKNKDTNDGMKNNKENNIEDVIIRGLDSMSKMYNDENKKGVNVTFYPEGGDLIYNLPCRVAFKATGSDGFGIDGVLAISGGIDSAYTVHDGMGSFIITPRTLSRPQTVSFSTSDMKDGHFNLPKAQSSGYSMISDFSSDSLLIINLWRTQDRVGERTALAVTCRGEVIHFKEITDIDNTQFTIDCSDWPIGVCRLTLFNNEGMILSSRSIFHNGNQQGAPVITVNTDSLSQTSFDKEVLEFKLTDQNGKPLRDRFCLSVRDAVDYGGGRTDNLRTNLLLSSDLRGYIHDPAWYLEDDDAEHREALNLLTLVQGWERYEWQTMTGMEEFEEKHRVEKNLSLNGKILSYSKREPVSDINVFAALTPQEDKKLFESFDYQTDSTGYFGFDMSDFYGKGTFTIHLSSHNKNGNYRNEKSKRIRLERAERPEPRQFLKQETDLTHNKYMIDNYGTDYTDNNLTPEQRKKLGKMIDDVDIEEENEKIRFIDYDTFTTFEGEEEAEFELDQGEYTSTLGDYLLEHSISFDPDTRDFFEVFRDVIHGTEPEGGMYLGLHYQPYFYIHTMTKFVASPPLDIAKEIDMISVKSIIIFDTPKYELELQDLIPLKLEWRKNHGGIDMVTDFETKYYLIDILVKEDWEMPLASQIYNLGRRSTTVKGFSRPMQFYSPEYPDGPISAEIDPRRTLYWNPNVTTDVDGNARVEFYNNSFTRRFTISGAGITINGEPYIFKQVW